YKNIFNTLIFKHKISVNGIYSLKIKKQLLMKLIRKNNETKRF
ncbi:hypothetical protein cco65_09517, partial [Campylobacter coli 1957]